MLILGIDPGPERSGVVLWDGSRVKYANHEWENIAPPELEWGRALDGLVFEKIESFGMAVGASVFETVFWTGVLAQRLGSYFDCSPSRVSRRDVKLHLCGSARAKDTNIRQALIDRFGDPGTKKNPGPLYGVKSHAWSALALAVTWVETR